MASHATLGASAQDRKARLAQLRSLKRKEPSSASSPPSEQTAKRRSLSPDDEPRNPYLSGRNYDHITRGPKLGFEASPAANQITLEQQAATVAEQTKIYSQADGNTDKPIDLFHLQPKKPNWDLKRDLNEKLDTLSVRTDNAIARLVRERIIEAQAKRSETEGSSEELGIDGASIVEAMHQKEREEEEEARREKEELEDGVS